MPLPWVLELFDYWKISPPMHELQAAQMGYRPPKQQGESPYDNLTKDDHAFMARLPQKVRTFDNLPLKVQNWLKNMTKK